MKTFAIYESPDKHVAKTVFVKQGFYFLPFFFGFTWALFKKLYLLSFILLLISIIITVITEAFNLHPMIDLVIGIGYSLFCGFNAEVWLQNALLKKNFQFIGVIQAANLDAARVRFFDEHINSS